MYSSDLNIANDIANAIVNNAPLLGLFLGIMIFSIILGLIYIISYWKIFNKAGKPGIASIIPIYNCIVMIQIAKLSLVYIVLLLIPVVNIFAIFKINIEIAKKFGKSTGYGIWMTLLPIIFVPLLAFSDNVYEDNLKDSETNLGNVVDNNVEMNNNIAVEPAMQPSIDNTNSVQLEINGDKEQVITESVENQETLSTDSVATSVETIQPNMFTENNAINETQESINLNSNNDQIVEQSNMNETIIENEPVVNIDLPVIENNASTVNDIPVVDEIKVENSTLVNAFNSKPIENIVLEQTPSIDLKLNEDTSLETAGENKNIPEITPQTITEIPVINEDPISTEQKKVCKNCGEVLPNIVSICPKCGTDNE